MNLWGAVAGQIKSLFGRSSWIVMALSAALLSGCAAQKGANLVPGEVVDPYEATNRGTHAFNLGVDKLLFRPAAVGYTNFVPDPIEDSFNAFARNLGEPGDFVNSILQGRLDVAGVSLFRFLINTTIGFGGLADAATDFGIPETDTDFGETLHVWGFGEALTSNCPSTARLPRGTRWVSLPTCSPTRCPSPSPASWKTQASTPRSSNG